MAQQIKKKFIGSDQIDGSKIKLLQGQSIRGTNALGQEVDLVKINSQDKVEVLGQEVALKSTLDQESSDRQSGDASTLASAQSYADQKIADLVNSAPEVLDTLKELSDALGGDANFATTIAGQIGAVDSKVDQEISDRQSADQALQQSVQAEQSRATQAEQALAGRLDILEPKVSTLESEMDSVEQSIQAERSARIDGDAATLVSSQAYTDGEIDALGATLDDKIDTEIANRVAGDANLQSQIDNVDGYAQDIRSDLDDLDGYAQDIRSDLDQEISDRQASDLTEQAARIAGDSALQSSLTQEISDRQSAVSAEASARQSADNTLQTNLDSEAQARQSADQTLQSNIDSEETRAMGEESRIEGKFDGMMATEEAARIAGDSALQSAVDVEKGRIDAILSASQADKDSFAEIVELINSVDTENDSAFASYVLSNNQALADEVSARQSAVSAEESDRIAADQDLQSQIDSEESRAMDVEEQLQTAVNGKVSKAGDEMSGNLTMTGTDGVVLGSQGLEIYGNGLESPATVTFNKDMLFMEQNGQSAELRKNSLSFDSGLYNMMLDQSGLSWNFYEGNSTSIGRGEFNFTSSFETETGISRYTMSLSNGGMPSIVQDLTDGVQNPIPFAPTEDQHIVVKKYVDQQSSDLSSRLSALEAQTDGPVFERSTLEMGAGPVFPWHELDHEAMPNSIRVVVGRLALSEGDVGMPYGDYVVQVVNGKSRIVWKESFLSSEEGLSEGDVVFITYARSV